MMSDSPIVLEIQAMKRIGLAVQQNGIPLVREISLFNRSDHDLSGLRLTMESEPNFLESTSFPIDELPAHTQIPFKEPTIHLSPQFLMDITEAIEAVVHIRLEDSDGRARRQQNMR